MKNKRFWAETEKQIKKVRDVLRDRQNASFTLSVKFYRIGSNDPKVINMQGERSVEGSWDTKFLNDKNSNELESAETLKAKLACIVKNVSEYIAVNALNEDWEKHALTVKTAMKSGLSIEELEYQNEIPMLAIAAYGYEAHFCAPLMATAYVIEGAKALKENNLAHASHCVERGLYWSNLEMLVPKPLDRFTERAREGGKGKASGYDPVKKKVAELMAKSRPNGWESTPEAIDEVVKELIFKHPSIVKGCGLDYGNLSRTVGGWVQENPEKFPHRIIPKA